MSLTILFRFVILLLITGHIWCMGVPDAPKKAGCAPAWRTENGKRFYEDVMCDRYPKYCDTFKLDPAQVKTLDGMLKPFRCDAVDRNMIKEIKKMQDLDEITSRKCLWAYVHLVHPMSGPGSGRGDPNEQIMARWVRF